MCGAPTARPTRRDVARRSLDCGAPSPRSCPANPATIARPHPYNTKMLGIDTEALILAVKKRPALYNKNDPYYYNNKKHKSKMWFDVCKEVFAAWDNFNPQTKVEQGHELQKRWKSLRTCFTRELSLQKREQAEPSKKRKRKRYEYFDMMSFLLETGGDDEEGPSNTVKDSDESSSDPLESIKNEPAIYEASLQTDNSAHFEVETEIPAQAGTTTASYLRPVYDRSENLEDKILDMLKEIKKDEEDEDRQFMLSLVPSFRKLKAKQKFEARIEILRVLKDITFRDDEEPKN
ncbi:hypothetical protein HW555_007849 [Spodoptera exigua]|uniref:BESS domain-containing protein n=1 Tax=Spodoptera exigua TaxID=7107 RepID=A0A835GE26_SPOEX|nr:hypothetical protein HW555_007849 [Spodoptera exigua]